jgi:catechol 2,3-dioxygenase-like lactoylglutathione lyase family enzyme
LELRRLCWLGVRAERLEEMVEFLRDVLGLRVEFGEDTTAELALPSGDRVQVFGPGHRYHRFYAQHAQGPVALFEVDDVLGAREELAAAGVELVGGVEHDAEWEWLHFRAPDGNLYSLASRRG